MEVMHQLVQFQEILKVKTVPECSNLIWRACKGILPMKNNMMRRKIFEDS